MDLALYIDQIDRYAEGEMSTAERKVFEAELASNTDLKQAYEAYLLGNEAIEQGIENSLRSQLQAWAAEGETPMAATLGSANPNRPTAKVVAMRPNWTRWAVAASVVLLAGFMLFRWAGSSSSPNEALFAANYVLPDVPQMRSGEASGNPLELGYQSMQSGDFATAADVFQVVPTGNDRYPEAQLWLGHAALQLKQYDRAIAAFANAAQRNDLKIKEKAQWNLALAYLAAGRTEDAAFREMLQSIGANPAHSYHEQAKRVMENEVIEN